MALAAAGPEHLDAAVRGLDEGNAALRHPVTLELLAIDYEVRMERYDAALLRIESIASRTRTWKSVRAGVSGRSNVFRRPAK